jgi:hypothetical protein
MESTARLEIGRNLGMAIQAQRTLRAPGKILVARVALGLVFGVIGNQRSRHNEPLKNARLSVSVHTDSSEAEQGKPL